MGNKNKKGRAVRSRVYGKWLFLIYNLLVVKLIIFKYPLSRFQDIAGYWGEELIRAGMESANFTPFKTISMYVRYYDRLNSFENLFGNVLIFIPFGFLLPAVYPRFRSGVPVLFLGFLYSLCVELFQLVTGFGQFDVDDILLNFLGVAVGMVVYKVASWIGRGTAS